MKYKSTVFKEGRQDDTGSTRSARLTLLWGERMIHLLQESTKRKIKRGKRIFVIQCV